MQALCMSVCIYDSQLLSNEFFLQKKFYLALSLNDLITPVVKPWNLESGIEPVDNKKLFTFFKTALFLTVSFLVLKSGVVSFQECHEIWEKVIYTWFWTLK